MTPTSPSLTSSGSSESHWNESYATRIVQLETNLKLVEHRNRLLETINREVQIIPSAQISVLRSCAQDLIDDGQWNEAKQLLEEHPLPLKTDIELMLSYARCLIHAPNYDQVASPLRSLLQIILNKNESCIAARKIRLDLYMKEHQFDLAIEEAEKVIEIVQNARLTRTPSDPYALSMLARGYMGKLQWEDAEKTVQSGLDLFPGNPQLLQVQTELQSPFSIRVEATGGMF